MCPLQAECQRANCEMARTYASGHTVFANYLGLDTNSRAAELTIFSPHLDHLEFHGPTGMFAV